MKRILELRIFQLLSEYTQHKASVAELTDAINELTAYLVEISTVEQDYAVLLRFYSMGLNKLKIVSYAIWAKGKYPLRNLLMKQ